MRLVETLACCNALVLLLHCEELGIDVCEGILRAGSEAISDTEEEKDENDEENADGVSVGVLHRKGRE